MFKENAKIEELQKEVSHLKKEKEKLQNRTDIRGKISNPSFSLHLESWWFINAS